MCYQLQFVHCYMLTCALPVTHHHARRYAAGWLSGCSGQDAHCSQPGKYPAVDDGIVEATVCFDLDKTSYNPCQYSVQIEMVNCGTAKGMLWKPVETTP